MPRTMRTPGKTGRTATPAQQLAGFISRFEPAIGSLVRAARAALRNRLPTANELVYDNYNALAIGFSSTDRVSDVVLSLAVYARGVNLYFMYGARLPDPHHVLKGSGNQGRFIPLDSVTTLNRPAVAALIGAAIQQAKTPLSTTGLGRLLIKSVSKRQRPRRPVATA
jgi:hypothetical protein